MFTQKHHVTNNFFAIQKLDALMMSHRLCTRTTTACNTPVVYGVSYSSLSLSLYTMNLNDIFRSKSWENHDIWCRYTRLHHVGWSSPPCGYDWQTFFFLPY